MATEVFSQHNSHVTSREANVRGWSRVPSPSIRAETLNLAKEVGTTFMDGNYLVLSNSGCSSYTSSTTLYPTQTWYEVWPQPIGTTTIQTIIKEKEVTKEVEHRTLYKVFVVDPKKNGKVLVDGKTVIAINENQAMLKADVMGIAQKEGVELEELDVYVQVVGAFIRPRKETQRVKIAKEEEE